MLDVLSYLARTITSFTAISYLLAGCAIGDDDSDLASYDQQVLAGFKYSFTEVGTVPSGMGMQGLVRAEQGILAWSTGLPQLWNGSTFTPIPIGTPSGQEVRAVVFDPTTKVNYLARTYRTMTPQGWATFDQIVPWKAQGTVPPNSPPVISTTLGAPAVYWDIHRGQPCRINSGVSCLDGTAWTVVSSEGTYPTTPTAVAYDAHRRKLVVLGEFPRIREFDSVTNTWTNRYVPIASRSANQQPEYCKGVFYDSVRQVTGAFCWLPNPSRALRIVEWDGVEARDGAVSIPEGLAFGHHLVGGSRLWATYDSASDTIVLSNGSTMLRGTRETLNSTNTPPRLKTKNFDAYATEPLVVGLTPVDEDGNAVTATFVSGPPGLTFENNVLRWTPPISSEGEQLVVVRLSDGITVVDETVKLNIIVNHYAGFPAIVNTTVSVSMHGQTTMQGATRGIGGSAECHLTGTNPGVVRTDCTLHAEHCSSWSPSNHCAQTAVSLIHFPIGVLSPSPLPRLGGVASSSNTCSSCTQWNARLELELDAAAASACGTYEFNTSVWSDPVLAYAQSRATGCGSVQ